MCNDLIGATSHRFSILSFGALLCKCHFPSQAPHDKSSEAVRSILDLFPLSKMPSVHYSDSVSVHHYRKADSPIPDCIRLSAQSDQALPEIPAMALPRRISATPTQRLKPMTPLLLPSTLELQAARPPVFDDEDDDSEGTVIQTPGTTACCFACGQDRPVECLARKCYGPYGDQPACDLCCGEAMIAPAVAPRVIFDSLRPKPPMKLTQ